MFAIVWSAKEKKLVALNASGRAGSLMTREELVKRGRTRMSSRGIETVTVPGALAGWDALLKKYGTITLAQAVHRRSAMRRRVSSHAGDRGRLGGRSAHSRRTTRAREATFLVDGRGAESGRLVPQSRLCAQRCGRSPKEGPADALRRRAGPEAHRARPEARRLPHARRSEEESADVGDADLDDVQGLSHLGAAAEQPGHRDARDAPHPRPVRPQGDGPELGARICTISSRRRSSRTPISRGTSATPIISRFRRASCCPTNSSPSDGATSIEKKAQTHVDAGAGAHVERDDLPHRRRQGRQHGVVHQQPVRRVRLGRRRAWHRVRAARSRRGLHHGRQGCRIPSRRASVRFTRSFRVS